MPSRVEGSKRLEQPQADPPPSALVHEAPAGDPPVLWTLSERARYLRRSDRWVWNHLKIPPEAAGSIPHTRLTGGTLRFFPADIAKWVAAGCPPAATFKLWRNRKGP